MSCTPVRSRPEWAILVLGLAGIPAIWLAFAWETSPMDAWRMFSDQLIDEWRMLSSGAGDASDFRDTAVTLAALLSFFLAPFVSLAQLSRCLGRPNSVWERGAFSVAASVAIAGCLAAVVLSAASLVGHFRGEEYSLPPNPVAVFGAFLSIVGALIPWFLTFRRHREYSAECMLLGAYIGGVAMWAALFADLLEPTAVAAGLTCAVYAVSLWRRIRRSDAAARGYGLGMGGGPASAGFLCRPAAEGFADNTPGGYAAPDLPRRGRRR